MMTMRRGGALIRSLISPFSIFKPSLSSSSSSVCYYNYSSKPYPSQFQTAKSSSPFESNVLRIISNEIQYHYDYAPPHQPVSEFDRFTVEDRPGERWITLRSKSESESESGENIKIEATMFDGHVIEEENVRLHISMLVDVWKGEGTDMMEFVCSAWPDSLEIQKVYIFRPQSNAGGDGSPSPLQAQPYMGPDIKNLNAELRTGFYNFLKARGVSDDLSKFLHEYMMNKDRIELIHWFTKLQSFFGR